MQTCGESTSGLVGLVACEDGDKSGPVSKQVRRFGGSPDLGLVVRGSMVLENKPGSVDRLVELLKPIESEGNLTKHKSRVIPGLMKYACGFSAESFFIKFVQRCS